MFIAYPLLSRLLQAYQNTHRVLTNYQESNILPSDIRRSIPRKRDDNIFGRSSDSFPIHTPSHSSKNQNSGKSMCANRLDGTHSSGSVQDFHLIPYSSATRTRHGNQTLHINGAKIQYFCLTATFVAVFFTPSSEIFNPTIICVLPQNALYRTYRATQTPCQSLSTATRLLWQRQTDD